MLTPTKEQIETLRDLFLKKLDKDGSPCEGGFHPNDLERVKTSDRWLQLFLEHTDLDMKQSLNMLWETCIWRKTYGTNDICENNIKMDYIEAGLMFPHNKDVDGKILLIFKSKLHVKGSRDVSELIRCLVYWIERLHRQTNYDQLTIFFDMQSSGLANMDMDFTKRIIDTFKLYYPNSLNYIMIYEMPWILNAAFKIIKALLPPKAVERMKFVNSKTMKEFISESNMLKNWGGTDDYEFKFEPENREKPPEQSLQPPSVLQNGVHSSTSSARKVHFANQNLNPPESPMTEVNPGFALSTAAESEMLKITPEDSIVFMRTGNDLVGSVYVANNTQSHITYKVKTTSPDKFRVRPSSGILLPAGKTTINVILQQGQEYSSLQRDKFLVMCMAISEEVAANDQSIADLWKNTPSTSPEVEQHRLRCCLPHTTPGDGLKAMRGNATTYHVDTEQQMSHFNNTLLCQLSEATDRLEKDVKVMNRLQWITITVFPMLLAVMMFFIKWEMNNYSSECTRPSGP